MRQLWIDGRWIPGLTGDAIAVHDPATEEIIDTVPAGGPADVAAAVAAASRAFDTWRRTPAVTRAELIHEIAARLTARTDELAALLTREGGKPLVENRDEIGGPPPVFAITPSLAATPAAVSSRPSRPAS